MSKEQKQNYDDGDEMLRGHFKSIKMFNAYMVEKH